MTLGRNQHVWCSCECNSPFCCSTPVSDWRDCRDVQGHVRHPSDEAQVVHWQIAAAGPSLEVLSGLPKRQVGTGSEPPSSATCCRGALPLCWVFASRISVPTGSAGQGCAELCEHQRKGRKEKEWWGQELLTSARLSTYFSVVECQLVPSTSPETTCHQDGFKNPLLLIFLKIVELSAHNLTPGVS